MWWNKRYKKWFSICVENPLKTWRKVKKYFKKPKWHIHFFHNLIYNCPYVSTDRVAKILDIDITDVRWKEKYDRSRHEVSPYIWVCFFKKFGFSINWSVYYYDEFNKKQNGDSYYWEYLLDYLYFEKSLKCYSTWLSTSSLYNRIVEYNKEKDIYKPIDLVIPVVAMSLNKEGIKQLKKLLNE